LLNKAAFNERKIQYFTEIGMNEIGEEEDKIKGEDKIIVQPFHNILQVLNNLVLNSIVALEKRDENRKLRIRYALYSENIIVEIADNGIEIRGDIKDKIFDMYFSDTGGTGIGLAHAAFVLENIHGSIKLLVGDEEYCTKFEITFPSKNTMINNG
jgi:signal transduction histidine kinase